MADTTGFTHITVSTDDDDVVIQAGIADAPEASGVPAEPDEDLTAAGEETVEEEVVDDPGEPVAPAAVADDGSAEAEGSAEADGSPAAVAARPDDGYHETTLQDLQDAKMSSTQKVVIVVALLGIIAFVAWYLFAR